MGDREDFIHLAIRLIGGGSQTATAEALTEWFRGTRRISPNRVNKWLNHGQNVPALIAQAIEALTDGAVPADRICSDPELKVHEQQYARYLAGHEMESHQ